MQTTLDDGSTMVEAFEQPAAAVDQPPQAEAKPLEEDRSLPPLPEIIPPLTPPEMVEITPLEEVREAPKPKQLEKKPEQPMAQAKPVPRPATKSSGGGEAGSGRSPAPFKVGGSGRFPSPPYPASARSAKQQGTVRLMVTVETSGIPSSVEIINSSGFSPLDRAARDTIHRRWRWPSGGVRKFIVPVRFDLQ
jgi:protein TonB